MKHVFSSFYHLSLEYAVDKVEGHSVNLAVIYKFVKFTRAAVFSHRAFCDNNRHGFSCVPPARYGSRVIGSYYKAVRLPQGFHVVYYRADDVLIERFYSGDFHFRTAPVSAFVGRFNVNKNKVVFFKNACRGFYFFRVVGIQEACRSFDARACRPASRPMPLTRSTALTTPPDKPKVDL